MIQEFVNRYMERKSDLRDIFAANHPSEYKDVVKAVISILEDDSAWPIPDPQRIHEIDDGDYQGTLVFVIGATGYRPHDYWYVKVGYGSCSDCDTLYSICSHSSEKPTERQINDYMTLALHIVQGIKKMGDYVV